RIAITVLAGKIHFHRQAGHAFQHELAYHSGMAARSTRCNGDPGERPYLLIGKPEAGELHTASSVDVIPDQAPEHFGLLVNLLQHEVGEAIFSLRLLRRNAHVRSRTAVLSILRPLEPTRR